MLYDPKTGEALPTEDILVWVVHYAQHRSPAVWGESANIFDPSRFLPENVSKFPDNAWRAFEKGARSCIGQDLALLEARIILALVVRKFEFQTAFDSLDELKTDGSFYAKDESFRKGKQDVDGEELYPILLGTAKPREGMPCRVKKIL
jgi:cytochrome P450